MFSEMRCKINTFTFYYTYIIPIRKKSAAVIMLPGVSPVKLSIRAPKIGTERIKNYKYSKYNSIFRNPIIF